MRFYLFFANYLYGNRVPWCKITHPNDNDALAKLNTPALLFGTGTDRPYTIIFEDSRGDSALGGGISVVYGFMYAMDAYGTQIAQHYSGVIRKRKKKIIPGLIGALFTIRILIWCASLNPAILYFDILACVFVEHQKTSTILSLKQKLILK